MKTTLIMTIGFLVGLVSVIIFGLYLVAMFGYVFQSESAGLMSPTALAYVPKWIFYLIPLVFLGKTRRVRWVIGNILNLLD